MIPLSKVSDFVHTKISNVKTSRNGTHFLGRCPLCGDSKKNKRKKRFNLNYNNGNPIYHCFNCGESGNFIDLYSRLNNISYDEARSFLLSYDNIDFNSVFNSNKYVLNKNEAKNMEIKYHDYIIEDCLFLNSIPESVVEQSYKNKLIDFYKERNIKDYDIYIAYKGDYKGRYIIPIFEDGHIIYFQGRAVDGVLPKYKNISDPIDNIILNRNNFKRNKYIIVTEGVIDAISIGKQGTTSFSADIKDERIEELLKYTDKGVIIAFDNDKTGIEKTFKVMHSSKHSSVLKYLIYPIELNIYKDMNVLSHKIENLYDFVVENSYSGFEYSVKMKIRGNVKI